MSWVSITLWMVEKLSLNAVFILLRAELTVVVNNRLSLIAGGRLRRFDFGVRLRKAVADLKVVVLHV